MKTLDIAECAEFLKINSTTASELAASGELPGAKIGRAWVFLLDDLVEYLRAEVRRQQAKRKGEETKPVAKPDLVKMDVISTFPAIRQKSRGRRTPIPVLPELVGEVAAA